MQVEKASADRVLRQIKSYVRREGRLTAGQQRALDELWPKFGIDYAEQPLDLATCFGRDAQRILEIGFGNGDSLQQMAQSQPETDYLGIEVHRPGVGHLLHLIEQSGITNLRVMCFDAMEILRHQIVDASFDRVQLFFPDPWHKKKHHKRRIVQMEFVGLVADKLKPGGIFHLATDWENYAEHILSVLNPHPCFNNLSTSSNYVPRPKQRPVTKFETRGQRLGHGVWDMLFQRI
jgi:tRNA (guanine-N7-)-methyltransferase